MIGRIGPFPSEWACCMGCGWRAKRAPYVDNRDAWRGRDPRVDYGTCNRCGVDMTNAKEWAAAMRAMRVKSRAATSESEGR